MTVNDLIKQLENCPGSAVVYTTDPAGWLTEAAKVIVRFDEKLNSYWVELVENDS